MDINSGTFPGNFLYAHATMQKPDWVKILIRIHISAPHVPETIPANAVKLKVYEQPCSEQQQLGTQCSFTTLHKRKGVRGVE